MKYEKNIKIIISSSVCLFFLYVWNCGNSPTSIPLPQTGNLKITVMDTASIDSINVLIDDSNYGNNQNPCTINDLIAGVHKLFVFNSIAACTTKTVEIFKNTTTGVTMWMASEGPYVGNIAPKFSTEDITGDTISLEEQKGRVVLLAFFEHT